MGIEHHLLRLAWVSADEEHPAVAEPDMRHLHDHRGVVDANGLVAPVELVGFTGCKRQRHIGLRSDRPTLFGPGLRITPDCVVATLEARITELLKQPDQGQALAAGLAVIRHQKTIQLRPPGANHWQRLDFTLVVELRCLAAQNLAHRVARQMQIPADLPDRPMPHKMFPPNPCYCIHALHPCTARSI